MGLSLLAAVLALAAYATLVLYPLSEENEAMRARIVGLEDLSGQVARLGEVLATLRNDVDEEALSYRNLLRDLRGWREGAHAFVSRIAESAGLEVTAMEWASSRLAAPAFELDERVRWLSTRVSVKLTGAWRGHRDFARRLSYCNCLVKILEHTVSVSGAGGIETSTSLLMYHPAEIAGGSARV